MGLEAAGWGEGRDLKLNPFIVILVFALLLLVLMTFLFGARRTCRVRNRKRAISAVLLPDRSRSLAPAHCGVLTRLGMQASRVGRRKRFADANNESRTEGASKKDDR